MEEIYNFLIDSEMEEATEPVTTINYSLGKWLEEREIKYKKRICYEHHCQEKPVSYCEELHPHMAHSMDEMLRHFYLPEVKNLYQELLCNKSLEVVAEEAIYCHECGHSGRYLTNAWVCTEVAGVMYQPRLIFQCKACKGQTFISLYNNGSQSSS
jgi:hypothetical protein